VASTTVSSSVVHTEKGQETRPVPLSTRVDRLAAATVGGGRGSRLERKNWTKAGKTNETFNDGENKNGVKRHYKKLVNL
jgi:hypothetical protein